MIRSARTFCATLCLALVAAAPGACRTAQPTGTDGWTLSIEDGRYALQLHGGLPVVEFLELAQTVTGRVYTVRPRADETPILLVGTARGDVAEFEGFVRAILYSKGYAARPPGEGDADVLEFVPMSSTGGG